MMESQEDFTGNSCYPLIENDRFDIILAMACGTVTMCCINAVCGIVVIVVIHLKSLPPVWRFLLTWLTVADIVAVVCAIISISSHYHFSDRPFNVKVDRCNGTVVCVVQEMVSSWTDSTTCLWSAAIGVFLFGAVWSGWDPNKCGCVMKSILLVICWLMPLAANTAAVVSSGFQKNDTSRDWWDFSRCREETADVNSVLWLLLTTKFWEILAYCTICSLILIFLVKVGGYAWTPCLKVFELCSTDSTSDSTDDEIIKLDLRSKLKLRIKKCKMYFWLPLIFVIIRIIGFVRFLITIFVLRWPDIWHSPLCSADCILSYVQCIIGPTLSIWNLLLLIIFNPGGWTFFPCRRGTSSTDADVRRPPIRTEIETAQRNRADDSDVARSSAAEGGQ